MNPQLQTMLQQAIQAFQNGNFDSADLMLRRVLILDSKNLPALHVLGLINASQANYKEAANFLGKAARINPNEASIQYNLAKALSDSGNDKDALIHHKKAVALNPNNPEIWLNYGKTASNLARYDDALACYDKALNLKPDYEEAALNKGATLKELKRYEEAITFAELALEINPNLIEAWLNKGAALKELKQYDEAITHYDKALSLKPEYADGLFNKGNALKELERYSEAISCYDKALSLRPNYAEALLGKSDALKELKRYSEAIVECDKALELNPNHADAYLRKGVILHELKQYTEAIEYHEKALKIKPDYPEGWLNKGVALKELKRYHDALTDFDNALNLKPDYHQAWTNKGVVLHDLKRHDEALAHFDKALSIKPDYAEALSSKAMLNLHLKKFEAGWENYDWRLKQKSAQLNMPIESLILWDGSQCEHLLVLSEQGVGDIIFYSSMLSNLQTRAKKITVSLDIRLLPILSRAFPEIVFIDKNTQLDESKYDAQIPFGSLPVVLKMHPNMDKRSVPYLIDSTSLTSLVNNFPNSKNKLRCGIAWKSNNQQLGAYKSLSLSDLNPILQNQNYDFINLQYGDTEEEIIELEKDHSVKLSSIDGIDLFENIDGLLSIIKTCDVIVTTSNVTAHLAGALGKNTLLLAPYSAGRIWYWHEEMISSWYPSISIYSQDQNFEWHGAIREIASKLNKEAP